MSSVPLRPASPLWRRSSQVLAAGLLVLGFAIVIAGYFGTSGTRDLDQQVVWLNVAAAGLLVGGAGVVSFLAAGRRAVGHRRLTIFGDAPTAAGGTGAGFVDSASFVAAPTMTRYHRAGCSFVEGKDIVAASQAAQEQAGRRPCGVCLPTAADDAGQVDR